MIRTILWYIFFWLYIIFSISFFLPFSILVLLQQKKWQTAYIHFLAMTWGRLVIKAAGGKVTVEGLEYVPAQNSICIIANHQGGFDIPLIMGYIPKTISFIAKKELRYIPILNLWMIALHCLFINRSNRRESLKVIHKGIEQIKQGHPMVVFPEGTRSKGNQMGTFKGGSLKLALRSQSLIVPVTIDGSYKLKEEHKGIITPAQVKLKIHPCINTQDLTPEEEKKLSAILWDIINQGLERTGNPQ